MRSNLEHLINLEQLYAKKVFYSYETNTLIIDRLRVMPKEVGFREVVREASRECKKDNELITSTSH